MGHCQQPGQHQQTKTDLRAYDAGIVQGEADGHIAIIGHGHKKEVLQVSKKHEEVHLCHALCIGDGGHLPLHVL
jgi:hypothetical protein